MNEEYYKSIVKYVSASPLVHGYYKRDTNLPLNRPEMALGEKLCILGGLANGSFDEALMKKSSFFTDDVSWHEHKHAICELILRSEVFLLRRNAMQLINDLTLPKHIVASHILSFPIVYLSFEVDNLILPYFHKEMPEAKWHSILVAEMDKHIFTVLFGLEGEDTRISYSRFPLIGKRYPSDEIAKQCEVYLKLGAFLNSKLAFIDKIKAKRNIRKQTKRAKMPMNCNVSVIELRDYETNKSPIKGKSNGDGFDFRFMVRGHLRAQWYPSEKAHHLIWIDNFLKGPPDAPIRPTTYDVRR